jgi:pyruvate,water dikinase
MGVVVQHQVDARAAGVLFTDAGDGTMLVEYTAGLADALVAGAIDPDRLSIDRVTGDARHLAHAGSSFALADKTIASLGDAARALEQEFGEPQDIEWVSSADDELWIVQSRPITASIVPPSTARKRISWSNANVNENFPGPISPLLYSIAAPGYSCYFRNLARAFGISARRIRAMEPAFRQIIGVHGARMYYNLTSIHSVLRLAPFGKELAASFDTFVGADGSDVDTETLDAQSWLRQAGEVVAITSENRLAVSIARASYLALRARGRRFRRAHGSRSLGRDVTHRAARRAPRLHGHSSEPLARCIACRCRIDGLLRRVAETVRERIWRWNVGAFVVAQGDSPTSSAASLSIVCGNCRAQFAETPR